MLSAQIDIPVRSYKSLLDSKYFLPAVINEWLTENGITEYRLCGGASSGDGLHADGTSNVTFSYIIEGIQETDCLAFKIKFPECRIYYFDVQCQPIVRV